MYHVILQRKSDNEKIVIEFSEKAEYVRFKRGESAINKTNKVVKFDRKNYKFFRR